MKKPIVLLIIMLAGIAILFILSIKMSNRQWSDPQGWTITASYKDQPVRTFQAEGAILYVNRKLIYLHKDGSIIK